IARRFQHRTVPRLTERYRAFLGWMLERDYTPKRALLRNTFALGAFTVGFLLLIFGSALRGLSPAAGMLLLVPGGLLLLVGILGILFHALESAFLGRRTSVKAGLILMGIFAVLLGLLYVGGRIKSPGVVVGMLGLPGVIIAAGFLGTLFARGRRHLVLTDNRARLLTGTLSMLIAIPLLFMVAPTGVVFFPDTDPNMVQVNVKAPLGTNVEASNRVAEEA